MSERFPDALIALLEETALHVDLPTAPDLSARVMAVIEQGSPGSSERGAAARPWFLRPVSVAATLVVLLAASLIVSSSARRAVADLLGVFGIEVEFGEAPPGASEKPLVDLDLGREVTASEARGLVRFDLRGTDIATLPRRIFFDPEIGRSGMISTLYSGRLLITEFEASIAEGFVKKIAADGSTWVRFPEIGRTQGYWLAGDPHFFAYEDSDGAIKEETVRLAGNVLLWSAEGVTYRIEGAVSLKVARGLAQRMGF